MVKTTGSLFDPAGRKWHMSTEDRKSGNFGEKFVQLFPAKMMELASDSELHGSSLKVYFWCLENLSHEAWNLIDHDVISHALGIGKSTSARAILQLFDRGFLERQGKGHKQQWRVSPKGSWCGTANRHNKAVRERMPETETIDGSVIDIKTGEVLEEEPA